MANQKMVELFHSEYPREIQGDGHLQHHGILGQKWGIRRFQPYPKGYHGDGKFVGKLTEKAKQIRNVAQLNAITVKNRAKQVIGKHRAFDTIEDVQDTKIARDFINSDEHRRAYKKYAKINSQRSKLSTLVERYNVDLMNPPKLTKKQYNDAVKKLKDLNEKTDKARNELKQMGSDYADKVLGTYGSMKTARILPMTGRQNAKDILTAAIGPAFISMMNGTPVPTSWTYRYDWGKAAKKPTRNDRKQSAKNINDAFWKGMYSKEGRSIMNNDVPLQATIKRDKKLQEVAKAREEAQKKAQKLVKEGNPYEFGTDAYRSRDKEIDNAFDEWSAANVEVRKQSERFAKRYLGRYGKTPVAVAKTTKLPFLGGMHIPGSLTAESELRDYISNHI